MASDLSFIEYICEQIGTAESVRYRKMFGEYAIYYDNKVIALVCDNRLFVKQTAAGRNLLSNPVEAPPYPGAKPCFLIGEELEDREWLSNLVKVSAQELPIPKPKKPKRQKA